MTDEQIAMAIARCKANDATLYHGEEISEEVGEEPYEIEDGVIRLGERDGFYSYPIDIAKFRAAFGIGE